MTAVEPVHRATQAAARGVLLWRWPQAVTALSSAAVGGGLGRPGWVLNVGVDSGYARIDLADHAGEVAAALGLAGHGVVLFTAAAVDRFTRRAAEGVTVHATVGVSHPVWAAPDDAVADHSVTSGEDLPEPGTINVVIQVPVALSGGAAVNAVITATEAKTQALIEAGIDGTGTATDAIVVVWPSAAEHSERFTGPRSLWGERIARCVHAAVREGLAT